MQFVQRHDACFGAARIGLPVQSEVLKYCLQPCTGARSSAVHHVSHSAAYRVSVQDVQMHHSGLILALQIMWLYVELLVEGLSVAGT